jgi:hypothetical protein
VYRAALAIYEGFVTEFFPALGPSFRMHRLLPARVRGTLDPGRGEGVQSAPGFTYIVDPLPIGREVEIDINLENKGNHIDLFTSNDELRANAELIARLRPDSPPWLGASAHSTVLNVFGADPATRLAENLLSEDLQRVGWVDSRRLHA